MGQRVLDILSAVAFLLAAGVMAWQSHVGTYYPAGPGLAYDPVFYPRVIMMVATLLATIILIQAVFRRRPLTKVPHVRWAVSSSLVLVTSIYVALLPQVGFMLSTGGFVFAASLILGARGWIPLLLMTLLFPVISWIVFVSAMGIPLPVGYLFEAG